MFGPDTLVIASRHPVPGDIRAYVVVSASRGYHLDNNFAVIGDEDGDSWDFSLEHALAWITGNHYWEKVWLPLAAVYDPDMLVDEGL